MMLWQQAKETHMREIVKTITGLVALAVLLIGCAENHDSEVQVSTGV